MASLGVVKYRDVVQDVGSYVIARWGDLATNAFTREQLEGALYHGVVVTVPRRNMLDPSLCSRGKSRQWWPVN